MGGGYFYRDLRELDSRDIPITYSLGSSMYYISLGFELLGSSSFVERLKETRREKNYVIEERHEKVA